MKKTMKKSLSVVLAMIMAVSVLAFTGCGDKKSEADVYVAMTIEMMGMVMPASEMFEGADVKITLYEDGKSEFSIEGADDEETNGKVEGTWTADGDNVEVVLEEDGEKMVNTGTFGENTIHFDDFLGIGAEAVFAIEGSEEANPDLYLSEDAEAE